MSVKQLFIGFLLMLSTTVIFAQARENNKKPSSTKYPSKKGFQLDKVVVGGNVGAQFGDFTIIEISPTAAYKLTENFLTGLGARYTYVKPRSFRSTNIYGAAAFSQYVFLEQFVLHAEVEYLSFENFDVPGERNNYLSPLVGGGFRYSIGGNSFANILILLNLNSDIDSPYTNPIIRLNLGFGL